MATRLTLQPYTYWSEHVKEHARALVVIFAGALALPEPEVMSFMVIQLSGSIR